MTTSLTSGTKVGAYLIETEVGRGGMGIVYRTTDSALNRLVALKLLAPHLGNDPDALARFHREASLAASLKHPNIATVYGFGEHQGRPYIAMEWIEGKTLKQVLAEQGQLPLETGLKLFRSMADALSYAHRRGVVHRDLKPANIIVGPDDQITVVDFGLAWLDSAPSITVSGVIVGTPRYMSPEQLQGDPVDSRTDQYSLALILFEMLTGRSPFGSDIGSALFHQQLFATPPPVTEFNPAVPTIIEVALEKALRKKANERFATIADFAAVLEASTATDLAEPTVMSVRPAKSSPPIGPKYRWPEFIGVLLGLVMVVSVIGGGLVWYNSTQADLDAAVPTATPEQEMLSLALDGEQVDEDFPEDEEDFVEDPLEDKWDELWPMASGDAHHTRFIEPPLPELQSQPRWEYLPEQPGLLPLVGSDGLVVVSQPNGLIQTVNWDSGDIEWETNLGAEIVTPPVIYQDDETTLVLVATHEDALYALDLYDARLAWRLTGETLGEITITGMTVMPDANTLLITTAAGQLHLLDPVFGEVHISLNVGEEISVPAAYPPTSTDAVVVLAGQEGTLLALEVITQEPAWTASLEGQLATQLLGDGGWGFVTAGLQNGRLRTFSTVAGRPLREEQLPDPVVALATDWERIFAVTNNGAILAWFIWEEENAWYTELEQPISAGPIVDNETVILGTEDGQVLFVEAESGNLLADRTLGVEGAVTSLMPIQDGLLVATEFAVFAFGPETAR